MRITILAMAILLAGCGDTAEKGEFLSQEEINKRRAIPVVPEAILYPDMEEHDLLGPACAFAPDGGGLGAIALAMPVDGYMKLRGEMIRFAADSGSATLPLNARSRYFGKEYAFHLQIAAQAEGSNLSDATLTVEDPHGNAVYEATGKLQCNG